MRRKLPTLEAEMSLEAQNSADQALSEHAAERSSDSHSGIFGFDYFDVCVVMNLAIFVLFSVPVDQFLLHPATQFFAALGYFGSLYFLGRTRIYHQGFLQIRGIHGYLHFATLLGGMFSGMIVCLFIIVPLSNFGRAVGIGEDWMTLLLLPPGCLFAFLIPYLSSRISDENEEVAYITCPQWLHFIGRGFILITANILLLHVYQQMRGESEDDIVLRSFLASFMMVMLYIPVRVQEMFLHPQSANFPSLILSTIALIFCGTAPAWLEPWLY